MVGSAFFGSLFAGSSLNHFDVFLEGFSVEEVDSALMFMYTGRLVEQDEEMERRGGETEERQEEGEKTRREDGGSISAVVAEGDNVSSARDDANSNGEHGDEEVPRRRTQRIHNIAQVARVLQVMHIIMRCSLGLVFTFEVGFVYPCQLVDKPS